MSKMEQFRGHFVEKVVLVAPPMKPEQVWGELTDWADNYPPLGLCYIGAYLRKNGYDVSIVDAEALRYSTVQTVERIVEQKPDIVGFNCKTLWVNNAHRVAQALKEHLPDVPIVAGGHHPTALPERTLKEFPCFDILVLGEGEVTFYELLQALNDGKDIAEVNGLAFEMDAKPHFTPPRERIKNLDELPMPAFDLIPSLETHYPASLIYAIKEASFPLMTSRGCPSKCAFCDRSVFRNRVAFHSPEYIMAMIEYLYHGHNIRYLIIDDDNFFLKRTHMYALLDMLKSSGLSIKFTCQGRVDTIDEEKLQRLKESGCERVMFGIESGSQLILDNMKKDITVEQAKKAIDMTKKAGLLTMGLFILGFPGETEKTLQETANFIYDCKLDDIICAYYIPLPGSEAYQDIEEHGTYHEDFENNNSTEPNAFVPHGTTIEMLKSYHTKCQNACYARAYQFRSFSRRVPTEKHLKAFKSFFTQG